FDDVLKNDKHQNGAVAGERCSWCGGLFNGGNCQRCTNVSFRNEPVYDSNSNSYNQTFDFSYPPSQPQTSSFDQFYCYGCGDPLEDGVRCQHCTCIWCSTCLREGICFICASSTENSFTYEPTLYSYNNSPNFINPPPQTQTYSFELCGNDHHYDPDCLLRFSLQVLNLKLISDELMIEQRNELFFAMQSMFEKYYQREQAANLSADTPEPSRRFNSICYDDYDYEESTILLNEIISQIPPSIVITTSPSVLPIEDPEVSLIMRNEELNTIPEKESDKFIKSSVEDLVPIPSESEDTSESDSECILPSCDDFSPINIFEEKSVTFSNPLFNSNDDFTSSDDESLSDADVPENNVKIYSNPLFEFDDEYISSDVNPHFDEVLEDIDCDNVELLLQRDPSIPKMSVAFILEGFTDEPPLEENDDLFDLECKNDKWKKILYDAPMMI
nr:hypothetical protein [Tanacetum cinerariifolium]